MAPRASGLFVQGVVFTFVPLLAQARGFGPASIGVFFLVLGLANTVARIPAGWAIDRGGNRGAYAVGGLAIASVLTALVPRLHDHAALLTLAALFGGVSGGAFVAISVGLSACAPPAVRGLVMGGYSTALYLGLGLGSLVTGPVIMRGGFESGFAIGGVVGGVGAVTAALLHRARDPHAVARDPSVHAARERPHAREREERGKPAETADPA